MDTDDAVEEFARRMSGMDKDYIIRRMVENLKLLAMAQSLLTPEQTERYNALANAGDEGKEAKGS